MLLANSAGLLRETFLESLCSREKRKEQCNGKFRGVNKKTIANWTKHSNQHLNYYFRYKQTSIRRIKIHFHIKYRSKSINFSMKIVTYMESSVWHFYEKWCYFILKDIQFASQISQAKQDATFKIAITNKDSFRMKWNCRAFIIDSIILKTTPFQNSFFKEYCLSR